MATSSLCDGTCTISTKEPWYAFGERECSDSRKAAVLTAAMQNKGRSQGSVWIVYRDGPHQSEKTHLVAPLEWKSETKVIVLDGARAKKRDLTLKKLVDASRWPEYRCQECGDVFPRHRPLANCSDLLCDSCRCGSRTDLTMVDACPPGGWPEYNCGSCGDRYPSKRPYLGRFARCGRCRFRMVQRRMWYRKGSSKPAQQATSPLCDAEPIDSEIPNQSLGSEAEGNSSTADDDVAVQFPSAFATLLDLGFEPSACIRALGLHGGDWKAATKDLLHDERSQCQGGDMGGEDPHDPQLPAAVGIDGDLDDWVQL